MKTLSNKKCLLIIGIYLLMFFGIDNIIPESFISANNIAYIEFFLDLVIAALFYLIVKDELRGEFNILKAEMKVNLLYVLKTTFLMWIVCDLITSIVSLIFFSAFDVMPINNANSNAVVKLLDNNTFVVLLMATVVAPFIEEILFRGAVFHLFSKINDEASVVLTSLVFALLHFLPEFVSGSLPLNIIPTLVGYLVLSYVITNSYYHHRNIFMSIGIHGLYNFISIVLTLILL